MAQNAIYKNRYVFWELHHPIGVLEESAEPPVLERIIPL